MSTSKINVHMYRVAKSEKLRINYIKKKNGIVKKTLKLDTLFCTVHMTNYFDSYMDGVCQTAMLDSGKTQKWQ